MSLMGQLRTSSTFKAIQIDTEHEIIVDPYLFYVALYAAEYSTAA
jgi:hypothetical protein